MPKLGPVPPEPQPVSIRKNEAPPLGAVAQQEVNRQVPKVKGLGVVPPNEVVVTVKQVVPKTVGVIDKVVSVSTPPPAPPKPLGVMEKEDSFPEHFPPAKPKIGTIQDQAVTPAAVAKNAPEPVDLSGPLVSTPTVVSPLERPEDDEKKK